MKLFCYRSHIFVMITALMIGAIAGNTWGQSGKGGGNMQTTYYYPPGGNNPPGPPPNYNLVDSGYFQGVPDLPQPLENNKGGYYIFEDTAVGKWYITNFLYSRGNSLEQFHGSILTIMDQPPSPQVNLWARGFELSADLKQNDRWGWVRWPDSIAENLYEIWWDITIDYAKPKDTGDFRDTLGIVVAGCAIDFNLWSSGHGDPFSAEQVYLGGDMTRLSDVPGFTDTYSGITDQYQVNDPVEDPNTSRFTSKVLNGETYNKNGLIVPGTTYGDRYAGSWVYEGNGIQFATLTAPPHQPPYFVTPDFTETLSFCYWETIYDTILATDPNPNDILTITQLSGPGFLSSTPVTSPVTGYFEFTPSSEGTYTVVFEVSDGTGRADTLTINYDITLGTPPVVQLPDDTVIFLCQPAEICLPLDLFDADCDIVTVTSNIGQYSGTVSNYDQVKRINQVGGTVIQIGGGSPGKVLYKASDFVPPVNSQSGVSVTLPNFTFASYVADYGPFPTGTEPGNSADYLLGDPTDMTFTAPGAGGPDGGDGDGSITFQTGDYCILGFNQGVTTCHGANVDLTIFTNTNGNGTVQLSFIDDDVVVHTIDQYLPGGPVESGIGGVTFDSPDGLYFDRVKIKCISGYVEIDAVAARTAPSSTANDVCFEADTTGDYQIIVTAVDDCGNTGSDTTLVTVNQNNPPLASAGTDINVTQCSYEEICFPVNFIDPDGNLDYGELSSGPGTLNGGQVCFTPNEERAYLFVIHAMDDCQEEDYDSLVVTVALNNTPVADDPDTVTRFMCQPEELCYTFTAVDPDGGSLTWLHLTGVGAITPEGQFCFTPTASGSYGVAVVVTDSCGASDTATMVYDVTINTPPVAADPGGPIELFQCLAEEVCYQFEATDYEGGTLTFDKISGDGTVDANGIWCFTPVAGGNYNVTVVVLDSCDSADTVQLTYEVVLNDPPIIDLGDDTGLIPVSYTHLRAHET